MALVLGSGVGCGVRLCADDLGVLLRQLRYRRVFVLVSRLAGHEEQGQHPGVFVFD